MFNAAKREPSSLDLEIERVLKLMSEYHPSASQYSEVADQLTKLYAIQERNVPKRVSKDTLAVVFGNLAGIVMIIGHEKANVISSKALSFVLKAK